MGKELAPLTVCPICRSKQIHRINEKGVGFDECKNCGEKFFDPHAIDLLLMAKRKNKRRKAA